MGFFSKIFRKKNIPNETENFEYKQVVEFNNEYEKLLKDDRYIARSDYKFLIDNYKDIFVFFDNNQRGKTLSYYCKTNRLDENIIKLFLERYEDIKDLKRGSLHFNNHNEEFLETHCDSEKDYLDNILKEVDPKIKLDKEQRKVVLSDEDYSLVIAGAGAGKTTTVAAKVRYLVEKKGIDPAQILIISFTNKAVGELKERINQQLSIPCPVTTFHSAGYAILRKNEDEKKKIVDSGFLYNVINNYLKNNILERPELVDKLIMFFGSYFDAPYEGNDLNAFFNYISKSDFSTLRSNVEEYNEQVIDRRTKKIITITNECLKSAQEVRIANYLYLNGIDYIYEEIYPYHILKAKKPYTPDFCIKQGDNVAYIEHFGITEEGKHSFYAVEELERYKQEIRDKIALHKKHNTKLLYTFSQYKDGRDLLVHLQEQLLENGFKLQKRSSQEVYEKLVNTEENKYIAKLVSLLCTFITNFKTDGYNIDEFYRFERQSGNVRSKLFLEVAKECYLEYQKKLSEIGAVDFEDMINDSARIIREKQISKEQLKFKYIIVDEYQDISRQRFDLTKELSTICNAKIIAVGDDWQSIYAFSGSDITLFTHFCDIMGYGKELKITRTYRNAQEVIDIAGNFIQKNDSQIKKSLISPKTIQKPVIIDTYSESFRETEKREKGGKYYLLGKTVEKVIGDILETNKQENKPLNSTILLIGRYNFDARNLCFSNDFIYDENNNKIFSKKYKQAKLEFLTAHSSKGLGYDNVIIINARNELYGFPSKIDSDPVFKYVIKEDHSIEYAEERRLFYVAMTRTKNRVYMVVPEQHPSEFVLELLKDYPNITLRGNIIKEVSTNIGNMKKCPICGYPLQLRWKKNYGMKLWTCTNEPEVCSFISNNLSGGDMAIEKCDCCKDGYLVVKPTKNGGTMLGCTNYKADNTGCNRTMTRDYYLRWKNNEFEKDESIDKPSFIKETIPQEIPKIKSSTQIKERKKPEVNKVEVEKKFIEKDGFEVLVDSDGEIITDMELLAYLRRFRAELMKRDNLAAYLIIGNKGLVSLATYKPTTREEFISLYGLRDKTYNKYGQLFINKIKEFYEKK